jgi:hypothetical protein
MASGGCRASCLPSEHHTYTRYTFQKHYIKLKLSSLPCDSIFKSIMTNLIYLQYHTNRPIQAEQVQNNIVQSIASPSPTRPPDAFPSKTLIHDPFSGRTIITGIATIRKTQTQWVHAMQPPVTAPPSPFPPPLLIACTPLLHPPPMRKGKGSSHPLSVQPTNSHSPTTM